MSFIDLKNIGIFIVIVLFGLYILMEIQLDRRDKKKREKERDELNELKKIYPQIWNEFSDKLQLIVKENDTITSEYLLILFLKAINIHQKGYNFIIEYHSAYTHSEQATSYELPANFYLGAPADISVRRGSKLS